MVVLLSAFSLLIGAAASAQVPRTVLTEMGSATW
jgi:hypothetical protein